MNLYECQRQLEKLFGAFTRDLKPNTLDAWFEDLQPFLERDLAEAVRTLKTSERLPNLGEVMRHAKASARRSQIRVDAQERNQSIDHHEQTRYGMVSSAIVARVWKKKITIEKAREYQRVLMKRYKIHSPLTMTKDPDTSREQLIEYQKLRWREDLSNLGAFRKVTSNKFEVIR